MWKYLDEMWKYLDEIWKYLDEMWKDPDEIWKDLGDAWKDLDDICFQIRNFPRVSFVPLWVSAVRFLPPYVLLYR